MDNRIVKHFEEELNKLNVELKAFDDAVEKEAIAALKADEKDFALKQAKDERDDIKQALAVADEKVALAEKELNDAVDFMNACKAEADRLEDADKIAKRDEFIDILAELDGKAEDVKVEVVDDVKAEDLVEDEPECDECKIEVPVEEPVKEVKIDEPVAQPEHKAVFDSLLKKRAHITIK